MATKSQIGATAERARLEVPPFLFAKLREQVGGTPSVYDLGCGLVNPSVYGRCLGLEYVYLIDPNTLLRGPWPESGTITISIRPKNPPLGLPAIAKHPGFSLRPGMYAGTEPWHDTLERLRPPFISFCSYRGDEMDEDLDYLGRHGYRAITRGVAPFRETLPLIEGSSFGDSWAVVERYGD